MGMGRMRFRLVLVLLLLQFCPTAEAAARRGHPVVYAGWAAEAYPEESAVRMKAMTRHMAGAGANVVWIGHNNPGEVDADKVEPGLSYAVFEAYRDPAHPRHADGLAIVRAQHRLLDACRAAGLPAVLPVGYQIQMGETWSTAHPDALRRAADGELLNIWGGGVSASFYAPGYREAIEAYYRWIEAEFVVPHADTLLMLNLADEPIGGDYSPYADAEFRRRYGFGFAEVGESPERQRLLGAFQSRYVVEYAVYSAELWQQIHPNLPVTMSFDGGQARKAFALPDLEALFRDTPANMVITFDAYPHDGLPNEPAGEADLTGLFLLARSLGAYSARYGKPVWLWAAANSWGLSQPSPDPGTISDAVANGLSLALLVRQSGGNLQGMVYWSYNVKEQGLYNNTNPTAYDADEMFRRVSQVLPKLRVLMAARQTRPRTLLLAPLDWAHRQIGAAREAVRTEVYPIAHLALLAQSGANAIVVGALDETWLRDAGAVLILCESADALPAGDRRALEAFLEHGGVVVAGVGAAAALPPAAGRPSGRIASAVGEAIELSDYHGLVEQRGSLYVLQAGVPELLKAEWRPLLGSFWEAILGVAPLEPVYRIVTGEIVFYYNLGPEASTWQLRFPYEGTGFRYGTDGEPIERIRGPYRTLTLARREYALIWRLHLALFWA